MMEEQFDPIVERLRSTPAALYQELVGNLMLRIDRYRPLSSSRPLSSEEEDRQFNIFCGDPSTDAYTSHLHLALLRDNVQANTDFFTKTHPTTGETYAMPHRFNTLFKIEVEWDADKRSRIVTMDGEGATVDTITETFFERILFTD